MAADANAFVNLAGLVLASSVITALVQGFFSRRKLGADATKVITDAASKVTATIESDNERLRQEAAERDRRMDDLENELAGLRDAHRGDVDKLRQTVSHILDEWDREHREWMAVLQTHVAFDHMAIQALRDQGHPDLAVPPLYPEHRRRQFVKV